MFKNEKSSYNVKSTKFNFFIKETKMKSKRKWKVKFQELAKACSCAIHR